MDPSAINERLAVLASEMQQIRIVVGQLIETNGETAAGLVVLDRNHAVADAKSDLRAERLVKLEAQIDQLAADLASIAGPVREHFEAQNRTRAMADANRANLFAYLTPGRIAFFATTLMGLGGGLGWWQAKQPVTSAPPNVQVSPDAGTVSP
jgi:hypothetical protein